jgi:nicotinamidase-related amidase
MAQATSTEPISQAVHLCIDMQNIFSAGGIWPTPRMDRVLPGIVRLVELNPVRTVFTRFITPVSADAVPGAGSAISHAGLARRRRSSRRARSILSLHLRVSHRQQR